MAVKKKKATKKAAAKKATKKAAKKATKKAAKKAVKKATKKKVAKKATKKAAKKATKKVAKKATKKAAKKKSKRKPSAAFMKPVTPDDKLAAVVGAKPLPRTELTKKLWAYIKKNKLQDPKAKRNINADDALKAVFNGKKTVDMFQMTKLVNDHLV